MLRNVCLSFLKKMRNMCAFVSACVQPVLSKSCTHNSYILRRILYRFFFLVFLFCRFSTYAGMQVTLEYILRETRHFWT